jgi:multisubunit Na+/H+ antiporter MnhF subunit
MCPHLLYMCPHTTIYASSYYYIVYMRPHTTMHVCSYYYICVLILLFMCSHTTVYVSSYYYICVLIRLYMRPHTTMRVCSHDCICVHTCYICVLILLRMSVWQQYEDAYVAVVYMRPHTAAILSGMRTHMYCHTWHHSRTGTHMWSCLILLRHTHMCGSTTIVSRDLASYYCDTHMCGSTTIVSREGVLFCVGLPVCVCVCVCVCMCVCVCVCTA